MFEFEKKDLKDVILVKPKVFEDERGFFYETYKFSEFKKNGIENVFIQDNHSKSKKGVLRGMHFQREPKSQAKLIRCIQGAITDVIVDIRKDSPTYKKWLKAELSEENRHILFVPKGFAHGFVVLSDTAQIEYKTDEEYSPLHDCGFRYDDEEIAIDWGLDFEPILSEKDKNAKMFREVV